MKELRFCYLEGSATSQPTDHNFIRTILECYLQYKSNKLSNNVILLIFLTIQHILIYNPQYFFLNRETMNSTGSFDWFQLSKINENQPNVSSFADLIRHAHFGQQLSRVPLSLRQKLLIAFQNSSQIIKNKYFEQQSARQQLELSKQALQSTIASMKQDLEGSILKIKSDKTVIDEKKKLIAKMKQKIKKKEQEKERNKKSQVYFCPLCTRQDFTSRQQFSFHLAKQHMQNLQQSQQNSNSQTIPGEVKQLILSLKDKEIELMQMMLQKKKQIQTIQLEKAYQFEIKKMKTQANFIERKSAYATDIGKHAKSQELDDSQQLRGQSQYLFYPSDSKNKEQHPRDMQNQYHRGYSDIQHHYQPRTERYSYDMTTERQMLRQQQKPRDYYNIFGDQVAISVQNSLSPQKINEYATVSQKPSQIQQLQAPKTAYFESIKPQQPPLTPSPLQQTESQIKSYLYHSKQEKNSKHSQISDESSEVKKYQSVYKQLKSKSRLSSKLSDGHIFNSGPLMDDMGDGSDYDDYFGEKEQNVSDQEVIDEEIKVFKRRDRASYQSDKFFAQHPSKQVIKRPDQSGNSKKYQSNHSSNSNNLVLQYSKDPSYLQISQSKGQMSHSKERSSDLIQLSNSFSKRGMDSSKNDETINLSDLKLSKLEREKQLKRQARQQNNVINELNHQQYQKMNEKMYSYANYQTKGYESGPKILDQFKRNDQIDYQMKKMSIRKTELVDMNCVDTKLKMPQNVDLLKTNPGVLQEFLYKNH